MANLEEGTTLTLPTALIEMCMNTYGTSNTSEAIRNALADFLLLPYAEQKIDDEALEDMLTIDEELATQKYSIRFCSDLLKLLNKLADKNTLSATVTKMIARILYRPLTQVSFIPKLLTVMGNKWEPCMQDAVRHILKTSERSWNASIESCFGGLGLFSNFDFAPTETINDSDWNKANLLQAIKKYPRDLIVKARALDFGKDTFQKLKAFPVLPTKIVNLDAAVRFLYLNITSTRGVCDYWDKNSTLANFLGCLEAIFPLHQKLQGIEILDLDIFALLQKNAKSRNTLFVIDPPYLDTAGYEKRITRIDPKYGKRFGLKEHKRLAECLHKLAKNGNNDFIYFCRTTATRHKNAKDKSLKETPEEIAKNDRRLQRQIARLYWGYGYYYVDIPYSKDGTTERIITSFSFKEAHSYGCERGQK